MNPAARPWWRTVPGICALLFLAIIAFYLLTEHQAHVYGVLPFLLPLGCLVMHKFMHGGHGHHHGGGKQPKGGAHDDA